MTLPLFIEALAQPRGWAADDLVQDRRLDFDMTAIAFRAG